MQAREISVAWLRHGFQVVSSRWLFIALGRRCRRSAFRPRFAAEAIHADFGKCVGPARPRKCSGHDGIRHREAVDILGEEMSSHIALHQELLAVFQNAPAGEIVHLLFMVRLIDLGGNREIRSDAERAYRRFCELANKGLHVVGARVLCLGTAAATLVGPVDEQWDHVHIIECPESTKLAALLSCLSQGEAGSLLRESVSDARLIHMRPIETW